MAGFEALPLNTAARLSTGLLLSVLQVITMFYSVSYSAYVCDDGVPERVTRLFDDFTDALNYWADLSEHGACDPVISLASLNEDDDDVPF